MKWRDAMTFFSNVSGWLALSIMIDQHISYWMKRSVVYRLIMNHRVTGWLKLGVVYCVIMNHLLPVDSNLALFT